MVCLSIKYSNKPRKLTQSSRQIVVDFDDTEYNGFTPVFGKDITEKLSWMFSTLVALSKQSCKACVSIKKQRNHI